ncbi:hypothetical protein EVAR_52151_1 [Eumeta japonica]|uniref:Uncharacterized protein n=1 Tax=Eumeta variegata TaxID=151549 RepID=A0A4C1YCI0_EUMVA|nr:hypothetical protein EVAR_52151_1 [Eumeta japonica]
MGSDPATKIALCPHVQFDLQTNQNRQVPHPHRFKVSHRRVAGTAARHAGLPVIAPRPTNILSIRNGGAMCVIFPRFCARGPPRERSGPDSKQSKRHAPDRY